MITARCIVEMVGSPKEHVKATMEQFVAGLSKNQGVTVVNSSVADPVESGSFFSTFSEIEARFSSVEALTTFCFDSMPSSIEILEPSTVVFKSAELSGLLNDLQAKLHALDMDFKLLKAKNAILDTNGMAMFRNFVVYVLRSGGKSLGELSSLVGIREDALQPYVDRLLDANVVSFEKGVFVLAGKGVTG